MSQDILGVLRNCVKQLKLDALKQPSCALHACRWLSGTYPDTPGPTTEERSSQSESCQLSQEKVQNQAEQMAPVPEDDIRQAEIIWDYMLLKHSLVKSDVLLVLGNPDLRVASYAALLWLAGYADWLMFSGELGNFTKGKWTRPEAEVFRDIAVDMGVPNDRIIMETKATNTGENIRYSYDILLQRQLNPKSIILVQMPFMERRIYATFMKQWPGDSSTLHVQVTSPAISLVDYSNEQVGSLQEIISILIGCLQRIRHYPKKGFQIYQHIPKEVWEAYKVLRERQLYDNFLLGKKRSSATLT